MELSSEECTEIEGMTDHALLVEIVCSLREAKYGMDELIESAKANPMLLSLGLFE